MINNIYHNLICSYNLYKYVYVLYKINTINVHFFKSENKWRVRNIYYNVNNFVFFLFAFFNNDTKKIQLITPR